MDGDEVNASSGSRSARRSAVGYQRGGVEVRFVLAVKGPVLARMRRWTEGTAGYEIASGRAGIMECQRPGR